MDIDTLSDNDLGAMLYHLQFPKREFSTLSYTVQESYRSDAQRLKQMIREHAR